MRDEVYFKMLGMDRNTSKLLSTIISKPDLTVSELPSKLGLSRQACDSLIRKLVSKRVLRTTSGGHVRIDPQFALDVAGELESSTQDFTEKLRSTRFLIVEKFVEEIEKVFQSEGYRIKRQLARKHSRSFRGGGSETELAFSFVAEKFYRFGILVITPELWEGIGEYRYRAGGVLLQRKIADLEGSLGCLGAFVFFDPRFRRKEVIKARRFLARSVKGALSRRGERFLFIHDPEEGIRDFLVHHLNEVDIRHDTVEERFKELKNELRETRDIVVENSMLISQLRSMTSGQYLPRPRKTSQIEKFMTPVENVVDREARNLEIFERKFEEEKTLVVREMDMFDNRLSLSNPMALKDRLTEVRKLRSKFEPIRHELRFLSDLIFFQYVKGKEPMKINPFILTEPNDIEVFVVNQERTKKAALDFFENLTSGGSNLMFLVGRAGSGKTHVLKHLFQSYAKEKNFWPIYVDCPVKYDIVSGLFVEIMQERNFPKKLHRSISSLRRRKVSTEFELVEMISMLHDILRSGGYKGLVLLVDELENSLPYTYGAGYDKKIHEREEPALSLRQLRGILSSDLVRDIGFVLAFRDHVLSEIKDNLRMANFNDFLVTPETLDVEDFKKLIEHRYETWKSKQIRFQLPAIREITSITDSNARHTIQYFRALYQRVLDEGKKTVTVVAVRKTGRIPLFAY